ncbi:hypothetical protein FVE85_0934 [Porphyridium purpureum]|uniref:Uncharacterized protein n=1 Tax=Porphyridium purpureum TaxID=35688 RepID=A0A5J4Z1I4_PORPP|nr:hypothetical protein FVE85_0934 [Porphyridium purpureum]|eukprot:POR4846..scf208_2
MMLFVGFAPHLPVSVHGARACAASRLTPVLAAAGSRVRRRLGLISMQMDVGRGTGSAKDIKPADRNELLLAEMCFSDPDLLPKIVQDNINSLDEDFYNFVQKKIADSGDLEERETLRILLDAINDVIKQMSKAIPPEILKGLSMEEVRQEQKRRIMERYEQQYQDLVEIAKAENSVDTAVAQLYDTFDMQFLELLEEKTETNDAEAIKVAEAIQMAMRNRMERASLRLRDCLTAGSPDNMFQTLETLSSAGEVDEAFVLLLAGNLQQAQQAGNENAARVLKMLQNRAEELRDQALTPEVALIRRLLRTEDPTARQNMLRRALQKKKKIAISQDTESAGTSIDGKLFVRALRKLIEEFGNVDEAFVQKLSSLGAEAEDVAKKLFNLEDKTLRDIQDDAFHRRSVSVFDLEEMEVQAELSGTEAPWVKGTPPAGFDEDGKRLV